MTKAVKDDTCVLYLMHAIRAKHTPQQPPQKKAAQKSNQQREGLKTRRRGFWAFEDSSRCFAPSSFLLVQDPFPPGFTQFSTRRCLELDVS